MSNMTEEDSALSSSSDNFYRFGFMLIKEPIKTALIVSRNDSSSSSSREQQPLLDSVAKFLTDRKWHATGVSWTNDFDDIGEKFRKLWPHLVVIVDRRPKLRRRKLCNPCLLCRTAPENWSDMENLIKTIGELSKECGSAIFVLSNRHFKSESINELHKAGVTKLIRLDDKSSLDESLHWLATCQLPLQLRLRACSGVFTALDSLDYPVRIVDTDHVVQLVNRAYEDQHQVNRADVIGRVPNEAPRLGSLPEDNEETVAPKPIEFPIGKIRSIHPKHHSLPNEHVSSLWKCLRVPGTSTRFAQFVNIRPFRSHAFKQSSNGHTGQRSYSYAKDHDSVDTPVSEILGLLKDLQRKCENDSEVHDPIQKAVRILNSTDLYSPLITRFAREDKVASDLFGGLVLNGLIPAHSRNRKTSLSEVMRAERSLRHSNRLLKRAAPEIAAVLKTEETWDFNIFELERLSLKRPLVHIGMKILQRWKVRDYLKCSDTCLRAWLDVIEAHYHVKNAYHNSTHAADVLHATAYYLGKEKVGNTIGHVDAVAALLASIVHDVDHPGRGNAFLINSQHSLAILYNDVAVLENHHAALTFQLTASDPCLNIFAQLSRQDYSNLRKGIVDLILATDMNRHFEYLAKFQTTILAAENNGETNNERDQDGLDTRRTICRILIKCADVSNPTRPWELCKGWAYRICEEYFAQTAEERLRGLPLTMEVFDRETCNIPLTQCSFVDMFVKGMFRGWCEFCDTPEPLALIDENYARWEEERKIWPSQRDRELSLIEKSLGAPSDLLADTLVDSEQKSVPNWSRLSLETTTLAPLLAYRQALSTVDGPAEHQSKEFVELL